MTGQPTSDDPLELVAMFLAQPQGSLHCKLSNAMIVYLRKHPLLTIANVTVFARRRGKGIFTNFLTALEPHYDLKIENVLNPELDGFFRRRGYREEPCQWGGPSCYFYNKDGR